MTFPFDGQMFLAINPGWPLVYRKFNKNLLSKLAYKITKFDILLRPNAIPLVPYICPMKPLYMFTNIDDRLKFPYNAIQLGGVPQTRTDAPMYGVRTLCFCTERS